jgi:hypothetical protein
MQRNTQLKQRLGVLCLYMLFWPALCRGQTLTWEQSMSAAMAAAQKEGKLILLFAGRPSCLECQYMESTVAESIDPPIAALIKYGYIPWTCDIDLSQDWTPYATGLGSFALPLICIISPTNSDTSLDRSVGIQSPQPFYKRLLNQVLLQSPRPRIVGVSALNGVATIRADGLAFGATTYLERLSDLAKPEDWISVTNFVTLNKTATIVDSGTNGAAQVFYRIRSVQ